VNVRINLANANLVLFTTSSAGGLPGLDGNSPLLRTGNVSAVVAQQSAARQAAANAPLNQVEPELDPEDLAYLAGRIFRLGPEDGSGVGPITPSKVPNGTQRDRQRLLKPPVEGTPAPPTSDRARTNAAPPISKSDTERDTHASLPPLPAELPGMDQLFDDWSDEDVAPQVEASEDVLAT